MLLDTLIRDMIPWKLQRSYNWELLLPDVGSVPGYSIAMYCQDVKFGDYNVSTMSEIRYGAFRARYTGSFEIEPITATFLKPIPDIVSTYIYEWFKLMVTQEGYFKEKANYAKTAYLYMYDRDGSQTDKFTLYGVFPKNRPSYNLSYGEESIVKFNIEFNVDRVVRG